MRFVSLSISISLIIAFLMMSCKKTDELIDFTEADEIALGQKLADAIAANDAYSIIPSQGNSIAYGYAASRLSEITSTSVVTKGEDFAWNIYLLNDDTRQAFAFPGGHIYISSGMVFFLDNEDQFSGLIAHLVAHVNQSHITEALFFRFGVNGLKNIANSGTEAQLNEIVDYIELTGEFISFTRGNEIEADTLAISMLAETSQSCESEGLFFSKILNVQSNQQAQFIAAHQLDEARLTDISDEVAAQGCNTEVDSESASRYQSFRNSLP